MTGVIFVMSDTFRVDYLGVYGSTMIRTPELDRFARESTVFDRAYIGSYPTVPNRLDLWTGRYNFPFRGWEPLVPEDVVLPSVLGKHGVTSYLVFDTPFLVRNGFDRGFSGWWQVRGHHSDKLVTDPTVPLVLPSAPHKLKHVERTRQYILNRADWRYEKDYIAPRTFAKAVEWLEQNRRLDKFFLMIDAWDPHEPFDPPLHYLEMYADPDEEVESIIYPIYGHNDYMSKAEMRRVRALYAGEVTMVDTCMGQLLDTVERLGLAEDTMIIFTTDHGHLFGEHGLQGKPTGQLGRLYEVTTRIPLIIRHPEGIASETHVDASVQPPDMMPTILDFFGIAVPKTVHGRSVLPLMTGEAESIRQYAFSARFPEGLGTDKIAARTHDGWTGLPRVISPVTITDKKWALICSPDPAKSELYDLKADPLQKQNLIEKRGDIAADMRHTFVSFMEGIGGNEMIRAAFDSEVHYLKESLPPTVKLHMIQDSQGLIYAYPTAAEAEERLSPEMMSKTVKTISFKSLLKRDPKALVCIGMQYYWAEELIGK